MPVAVARQPQGNVQPYRRTAAPLDISPRMPTILETHLPILDQKWNYRLAFFPFQPRAFSSLDRVALGNQPGSDTVSGCAVCGSLAAGGVPRHAGQARATHRTGARQPTEHHHCWRAGRATSTHPKFYLFDAGVYRSLRPRGPLDRAEEIDGCAFEGLVAQHLRAWIAYAPQSYQMFFWRTASGVEVDFIVYGAGGFWAIEVKHTSRVRPQDLRGLKGFCSDYPECQPLLLLSWPRTPQHRWHLVLSWGRFLATPASCQKPYSNAIVVPSCQGWHRELRQPW